MVLCHNLIMTARKFAIRFVATVLTAAVGAVSASAVLNVDLWKTAVAAGLMAALPVIKRLLAAAEDGEITAEEADQAFEEPK